MDIEYLVGEFSLRDASIGLSYTGKLKGNEGEVFDILNEKLYKLCEGLVGKLYINTSTDEQKKVKEMDVKEIMSVMCGIFVGISGNTRELERKKDTDKFKEFQDKNKELIKKIGLEEKKFDEIEFLQKIKDIVHGEVSTIQLSHIVPQVTLHKEKEKGAESNIPAPQFIEATVVKKQKSFKEVDNSFFSGIGI